MREVRVPGDIYVEWVGDEAVVLDRSSGELHYLNPTAATVLAFVEEHGYDRGVAEVAGRFGLDPSGPELQGLLLDMLDARILVEPGRERSARAEAPATGEPHAAPG